MTSLFFFFQAEDGIRDYKVTGVQTCALPISARPVPRAEPLSALECLLPLESGRRGRGAYRPLPGDRAHARGGAAAPAHRGARAHGVLLDPRAEHPHPCAHRGHQHASYRAPAAHRAAGLRLSGGRHDARVAAGKGLGVRRHHPARGVEYFRHAACDPDIRHLEPAAHPRRARADPDRHRDLCAPLRLAVGADRMNAADGALPVVFALGLAAVTLPVARAAPLAISAEMQRCAAITAPDERLACYDALKCAAITASDERLACYDALAKDKPVRPPPAPAAPNFHGAAREAGFGLAEHVEIGRAHV